MAPDLHMVNRMIYVYMTTAAMISSMFAYSVNRPTFYAFTLPIMIPAMSTLLWPTQIFPWPFSVGLAALYLVVLGIAKNFSKVFEESVSLRFRNEHLFQELANERDQSVYANVAKSKFIASASHDLRQPLQAININLDLYTAKLSEIKDQQLFNKIKSSVTALNTMFDALLNMSKLDAYSTQPENRTFELQDLANTIIEMVYAQASNKGIQFNVHADNVQVQGDPLLLQQILVNLVLNAIQYTAQGGVEVRFFTEKDALCFSVSDTGVGIEPSDQSQIFKEFYRVDRTRGEHEGLGLGLTIVARLCHLMDATVHVDSKPGEGSIFTVKTNCPMLTSDHLPGQVTPGPTTQTKGNGPSILSGKHIAIVEDDENILDAYRMLLSGQGAVVHALSENDADLDADLLHLDRIDCLLCDYRLKQTTGNVLIEKLRESYNCEIPAIIVTADTSPEHIHIFEKMNVPVLYKPVTFGAIVTALENVLIREKIH
jgi:signal transduction histidine kinase